VNIFTLEVYMRSALFLIAFALFATGCEPSVMTEKVSSQSQIDNYNSQTIDGIGKDNSERIRAVPYFDEGRNDYLPLAVGNRWRYSLTQTITTQIPNENPVTSYSYGFIEWVVVSAIRKNDTTDEFKIRFSSQYPGESPTTGTFSFRRSKMTIYRVVNNFFGEDYRDIISRTGKSDTLDLNRGYLYYIKGIGMGRNTWGYNERRYSQFNDQRLVEYSLKP